MFVRLSRERVIYSTEAGSITSCQAAASQLHCSRKNYDISNSPNSHCWLEAHNNAETFLVTNWFSSVFTRQGKNRGRPPYCDMCTLHARPLLEICIGLAKAKVQGGLGLTAIRWQPRWESDVHSGRSPCVSPPANTGSLGARHAPFNFTGHPHPACLTQTHKFTHAEAFAPPASPAWPCWAPCLP